VPVAVRVKLAVLPAHTVCAVGWAVIAGAVFTVKVAAEEVTLGGHVPLSTTRYCLPLSPDTVAAVVKLAEVAPLISLNVVPASVLNCH
jgi:hypothetical protein